ncbi:MAG: helix-turn-helix transcriptional regulator, partial [Planctomycetaceae bacterium]|nr:helix-turn-helix transcriptional regulator [Planctomycetaceae bacterium]
EIFGDRWTLLILRDLLFKQCSTFREFQASDEGIATNILADRLKKLQLEGIIEGRKSPDDARVISYRPTAKGLDLLPAILEMIVWAARYEKTAAPPKVLRRIAQDRESFIAEVRRQFEE